MALYMKYFVLKPEGDDDYAIASRRAMSAYAKWLRIKGIEKDSPEMRAFGAEIDNWVDREWKDYILRKGEAEAEKAKGPI